jgi:hypothetical protein
MKDAPVDEIVHSAWIDLPEEWHGKFNRRCIVGITGPTKEAIATTAQPVLVPQ